LQNHWKYNDFYLQELPPRFRTSLFGAFATALHRRQFSRLDEKPLGAHTVEEAMAKLGQIIRSNVGYNPIYDKTNRGVHPHLARQFRGMKNSDPRERSQKALPVCVYREIYRLANLRGASQQDKNFAWLLILAFFLYAVL
jgi:hypothetical protein